MMLKYIHNWLCMMCGEQNFIFLWIIRWNPKSKQPKYTNSMWGEEGRKEDKEATVRSRNWSWNHRTGRWNHEWNNRTEAETVRIKKWRRGTKRGTGRQEVVTVKKHQVWQRELVEKALVVGLALQWNFFLRINFTVELNVKEVDFKVEIGLEIILVLLGF